MTERITYSLVLIVTFLSAGLHAVAQTDPSEEFTPFVETRSIDHSNDDGTRREPAHDSSSYLDGRLEEIEPLTIDRELLVRRSYFRLLARQIRNNTSGRQEIQGLVISREEQREILDLLEHVESEDRNATLDRVNAMCDSWDSGAELPPSERADRALSVGRRMELEAMTDSETQEKVHAGIAEVLGSRSDQLDDAMDAHGVCASIRTYSWSDVVRQVGREVEQMEYMCRGEQ